MTNVILCAYNFNVYNSYYVCVYTCFFPFFPNHHYVFKEESSCHVFTQSVSLKAISHASISLP